MKNPKVLFISFLIILVAMSCRKEAVSNRDKLILGTWDCTDYADSVTNELKGYPPVFISNLYEKGYVFKRKGLMWTRNMDGSKIMFTDKSKECEWVLSNDKLFIDLIFPDKIETYDIVEMTRHKMILRGVEGFWAGHAPTYVFEKQ